MPLINLLSSIPKPKRSINSRETSKTNEHIRISRMYGKDYFDGDRSYGYGGYKYDGRWIQVAKDIINYYDLNLGDKILDVGCAKGFLVKDFIDQGIDAYGIDISEYAIKNCIEGSEKKIKCANALNIPFEDNYFDAVISLNTIHNLDRDECKRAINEILRVGKKNFFIQVDSYETEDQKKIFESWVLTAKFYGYPSEWLELFKECNYQGDYYWTIIN